MERRTPMEIIVYGTRQCPDTCSCLDALETAQIPVEFRNLEALEHLKEFLAIRDSDPIYDAVKARGGVGIPLLIKDGVRSFHWDDLL